MKGAYIVKRVLLLTMLLLPMRAKLYADNDTLTYPKSTQLPTLTVEGTRLKYDKNNPAAQLIRQMVAEEQARRKEETQYPPLQKTDLLTLSLANVPLQSKWLHSIFPFFKEYLTPSTLHPGYLLLPLSQRELISHITYKNGRKEYDEQVLHQQTIGLDQNIDNGSITLTLENIFPRIDLFRSTIPLLQHQFPSPLYSSTSHYQYHLTDTLITRGLVAYNIAFEPQVKRSTSFRGMLLVSANSPHRLLQSYLEVPPHINLNYVDSLRIHQYYGALTPTLWHVQEEQLNALLTIVPKVVSLEVNQTKTYQLTITGGSNLEKQNILPSNKGLRSFMDKANRTPRTRLLMDLTEMISHNHIRTNRDRRKVYGGSYFDIGPITNLFNYSDYEGIRLQVGGRTTGYLSKHFFLEGYWAYGYNDQKHKYLATASYSFVPKRYFKHEYPRHEVSISKEYNIYTPGQYFNKGGKDNILYSVGTPYLTDLSYRNTWRLEYINDLTQTFGIRLYTHYYTDTPTGTLDYVQVLKDQSLVKLASIKDTAVGMEVRWAPGEQIRKGSIQRHTFYQRLQNNIPIFYLKHEMALQAFGGNFTRNRTELSLEQRLWLGTAGRIDYHLNFGKLWDHVPYPMLYTAPTNQNILLQEHTFQLLRPLEFIADEWMALFAEYHLQGLLLNRIPYINKLNLRGVIMANFLLGNTSRKNSQATSEELFVLPTISSEMHYTPYLELGIGLDNILRIARVDYYHRLTRRGPHSKAPWAIRATFSFNF